MPSRLAAPPPPDTARPPAVAEFAGDAPSTPVWRNTVGGLTFRVDRADGPAFVKWNPGDSGESLVDEARRLDWLLGRFPAPRVLAYGLDDTGEWLATAAIDGVSAVAEPWRERPVAAARAMGEGLRRLHDGLDPDDCPFDWSLDARLADAARRGLGAALPPEPTIDRLVVCHGDPCAPNTLIDPSGGFAAIVDVGRLGVADRWADLAVASWSLEWNFGAGFEGDFFDGYGIAPDPERIAFYRAVWDAT